MDGSEQKSTILAVDDSKVMLVAAAKALKAEFEVLRAADGAEAWEILQQHPEISVVFTDLSMPVMDGYELLSAIRDSENPQIAKLPVVILTGQEDGDGTKEKVLAAGATDFLIKPFESLDLLSRARSLSSLSTQVNELEKKVSLDKLTRLYTEISFKDSGERAVAYAARHAAAISVMKFNIEGFSSIFVKHGKELSESVLIKVAEIVKSVLRQEDIAARTGVAKFSLLLIETDEVGVTHVVDRVRKAINAAVFEVGETISINVGCASSGLEENINFNEISADAEEALLKATENPDEGALNKTEKAKPEKTAARAVQKKGPRIDLSAVMREVEGNEGKRLGEKQLNAALNSVIPLLSFLNKKMSLGIESVIEELKGKVIK